MTNSPETREQVADAAAWEAWPSAHDFPEREAFKSGYLAALTPTPAPNDGGLVDELRAIADRWSDRLAWHERDTINRAADRIAQLSAAPSSQEVERLREALMFARSEIVRLRHGIDTGEWFDPGLANAAGEAVSALRSPTIEKRDFDPAVPKLPDVLAAIDQALSPPSQEEQS